jgi:hypothetical protein
MAIPLARTVAEAHLFIELHPCERCGETEFRPDSALVMEEDDLASSYSGPCPRCGNPREFVFRIPEEIAFPDPDEPSFGDDRPSELLDAGEWLWVADLVARNSPAEPDDADGTYERRQARVDLLTAAALVGEAAKFIPPGADRIPPEALWSDRGRAVYHDEPGRFRRARLEVVQRTYRDIAERFAQRNTP